MLLYAIALMLVAANVEGVRIVRQATAQEQNCEDCENQMDSCLKSMGPEIKTAEPVKLEPPSGPCKLCNVTELHTVTRNGQICSEKGADESWTQDMHLQFQSVYAVCDCFFKNDKAEDAPVKLYITWTGALVRTILKMKEEKCTVVSGAVDCEPGTESAGKCTIPKDDLDIKCEGDDKSANEKCEDAKQETAVGIMQAVAESSFPGVATEKINQSKAMVKRMTCETIEDSGEK